MLTAPPSPTSRADGALARSAAGAVNCRQVQPCCAGPYQVGYTPDGTCFEGCVRTQDCGFP